MGAHLHSTAASDIVLQRSRRVVAIEAHCLKWDATERSASRNDNLANHGGYQ